MTSQQPDDASGLVDDDTVEHQEPSSAPDSRAASGEYDPAEGSPEPAHPVGETFPDEATKADGLDTP